MCRDKTLNSTERRYACPRDRDNGRRRRGSGRHGFTLVELLIVISIMVILAAIVIPKLRVVTADRKIREAARVVESMFASARDDAVVSGFAAVELVRNKNFANGSTSLFRMRMRPPYSGDFVGDGVTIDAGNAIRFWSWDSTGMVYAEYTPNPAIEANDFIQFNYRGPLYRLTSATTFEVLPYQVAPPSLPAPPTSNVIPFKIFRKPIRITASEVRLPAGQLVDLRFSGDPDTSGLASSLNGELNPAPPPSPNTNSFVAVFDQHGAIERYYPQGFGGASPALVPAGPLFLLVSADQDAEGIDPLQNMSNLWVSVNHTNGAVKVSEIGTNISVPAPFYPAASARLDAARALAMERRNAHP